MPFDQTFFNWLVTSLLGMAAVAGAVAGLAKLCLGNSWSNHSSRNTIKHHEK